MKLGFNARNRLAPEGRWDRAPCFTGVIAKKGSLGFFLFGRGFTIKRVSGVYSY